MKYKIVEGYRVRDHPLYWTYHGMLARCYYEKHKDYQSYGGRGIKVVDRWRGENGFKFFVKDMGPKPEGYTINRINNNRGYGPENCEWSDIRSQSINRRNSRNTSGYVGVSWHKRNNKWWSFIDLPRKEDGKKNRKSLGYYQDLGDAINARKQAQAELDINN